MPVSSDGSPDVGMWWLDGGERLPDIFLPGRLAVPGTVSHFPALNYHSCGGPLALVAQSGEHVNPLSSLTGFVLPCRNKTASWING